MDLLWILKYLINKIFLIIIVKFFNNYSISRNPTHKRLKIGNNVVFFGDDALFDVIVWGWGRVCVGFVVFLLLSGIEAICSSVELQDILCKWFREGLPKWIVKVKHRDSYLSELLSAQIQLKIWSIVELVHAFPDNLDTLGKNLDTFT